ncbi:AAA family ATPase (plasmid) [Leptolyngbya sp. NK1-12]|uniref:AAA family ATPase n=1 Tax=Leptolyngbya sp. NK1-12 TaxID=2547451 RepID=A0AA96WM25_9CYAN|nr:AAA family ATPase [Leptolyngbya sp. NK1-12]
MFRITDYTEFDPKGRAVCPCCALEGKLKKNLALIPGTDGAYKCHRGCTPEQIRAALGAPKDKQVPAALAAPARSPAVTITPQKVREAYERLISPAGATARKWLNNRGISDGMIRRYQLGLTRSACGGQMKPAISIPIPANADGTSYYQKKRVEPWIAESEQPPEYSPWVQKGIPAKVWFTWLPAEAEATWLCEGEWDAIMLGWQVRQAELPIAVASFTCGCSAVPPPSELKLLPGEVVIFYDRNDKPLKDGTIPGEKGATKLAQALGERGKIALVPMPQTCQIHGWDVSDALNHGFTLEDFLEAANRAVAATDEPAKTDNPLRAHLQWNDDLLDNAPEYTDWLVPDLLTTNELFLLAAGPRTGKSLLAMTLAKAVAAGERFMDRPVLQGPVIYIRKEDGDSKTKERELAQGWERGLPVAWLKKFKLSELNHLRELAEEIQPRLIVIDTLSRVKDSQISESSAEMSQLLEPLQEMAEELDICILLVHHTGKVSIDNAGTIDPFDTIRGSSAIRATCRGSIVLAAGDRNYRLMAENGWGKHDLNVVLDANTLTWRLLGQWNPTFNGSQTQQVIDYLKSCQIATIDQMSADLGIPKMSLYKTLERLQASDVAGEKVVKEGRRRSYTYRLAIFEEAKTLFDTIGLSNSVSNRPNPDSDCDRGGYLTKNDFFSDASGSIIDQTGTCDTLIDPGAVSRKKVVKYRPKIASKLDTASVLPIGHLFDTDFERSGSKPYTASDSACDRLFDSYLTNPEASTNEPLGSINLQPGDRVEIIEGRFYGSRATVQEVTNDEVTVRAARWVVNRSYRPDQLRFIERGGSS